MTQMLDFKSFHEAHGVIYAQAHARRSCRPIEVTYELRFHDLKHASQYLQLLRVNVEVAKTGHPFTLFTPAMRFSFR